MNISRRRFIRQLSLGSAGATAGLLATSALGNTTPVTGWDVYERLSIPEDWFIRGYKTCYHGRAKDPQHLVDLLHTVCKSGAVSAGFVLRMAFSIAKNSDEANEAVAYLNRGIRDRWLMHGAKRSSFT